MRSFKNKYHKKGNMSQTSVSSYPKLKLSTMDTRAVA